MLRPFPVFAINLQTAPHRWEFIQRQCHQIGLAPARINASTGSEPLPAEILWTVDGLLHDGWCLPEVGCLLSHMAAWRSLLSGPHEFALVLEDDVIFGRDAREVIESVVLRSEPHVIKLETWLHSTFIGRYPELSITEDTAIHRLRSLHKGAAAYLINRAAATLLLGLLSQAPSRADDLPFNPDALGNAVRVDQVVPAVVMQQMFLQSDQRDKSVQSAIAPAREAHLARLNLVTPFWTRAFHLIRRVYDRTLKTARYRRLVVPFLAIDNRIVRRPGN